MLIPDTYSYYSKDVWGSPLYEWVEKDGDDDTAYWMPDIPELLNEQAQQIADLRVLLDNLTSTP